MYNIDILPIEIELCMLLYFPKWGSKVNKPCPLYYFTKLF